MNNRRNKNRSFRNYKKTHGLPAFVSMSIPGLGQIIKGHVLKGIGILLGMATLFVLCVMMTPFIFLKAGFFAIPLPLLPLSFYLWQIHDAYNS